MHESINGQTEQTAVSRVCKPCSKYQLQDLAIDSSAICKMRLDRHGKAEIDEAAARASAAERLSRLHSSIFSRITHPKVQRYPCLFD